jgi:subtilisin-like proprotein convertase family protein
MGVFRYIKQVLSVLFVVLPLSMSAQQDTVLLNCNTTLTSCDLMLYDSGGENGNYSNNENYTLTVYGTGTNGMVVDVISLATESQTVDYISIYEGESLNSEFLVASLGGRVEDSLFILESNCVTIRFRSDYSINMAGFVIRIHCQRNCQEYSQNILYDDIYEEGHLICNSSSIVSNPIFYNNNVEYEQTIANTFFRWNVISENREVSGMGLNTLDNLSPGMHLICLSTFDVANCIVSSDTMRFVVMNELDLSLSGVPEIARLDDTLVISCDVSMDWDSILISTSGCIAASEITFFDNIIHGFPADAVVNDINDIESICLEMEHSYLGDLEVWITCPSGNRMEIFNGYDSFITHINIFMGEPIDDEPESCMEGVPYNYCWTHDASQSILDVAANPPTYTYIDNAGNHYSNHRYIPAGDYIPSGDWSSLLGCPLNGDWRIFFADSIAMDDGFLSSFSMQFNSELYEDTAATPIYEDYDFVWNGHGIISGQNGSSTIVVSGEEPGLQEYMVSVTNNYGCTYDTTFSIYFCSPDYVETFITECDSAEYNGVVYYESGDYMVGAVCGDEEVLHLTINHSVDTVVYVNNFGDYLWNDETFAESGTYTMVLQGNSGCDSIVTLHLTITDIAEFESEKILLYPNPADDIVNIVSEAHILSVDIVSPIGQVVCRKVVNADNAYLDIKNISSGAYYVRVWFGNDKLPAVMKFVKQEP